jgi:hypothetical protein
MVGVVPHTPHCTMGPSNTHQKQRITMFSFFLSCVATMSLSLGAIASITHYTIVKHAFDWNIIME